MTGFEIEEQDDPAAMEARRQADKPPPGVVAILVSPTGDVVAHAADFERHGYGGCTGREAQQMRVRYALASNLVSQNGSPVLMDAFQPHHTNDMLRRLVHSGGYKIHLIPIGYEEGDGS